MIDRKANEVRRRRLAAGLLLGSMLIAAGCDEAPEAKSEEHADASAEHEDAVKLSAEAVKRYGIVIEPVKRHRLVRTLTAPARVAFNADAMAHVGAALRGRVVELKVRKGDVVKKGDELVVLESPELGEAQSDFLQKRTAAEIAGPAADLARSAYDRAKSLYEEQRGIALTELQKREAEYKAAAGAQQTAKAALLAAENKLHLLGMNQSAVEGLVKTGEINPRYSIRAPINGTVTSREVTLGELASAEKDALLVLADMSTLWVVADVPEARLKDVAVGSTARVTIAALATDAFEGSVSYIDPSLDPNSRSARVRIEVKAAGTGIRPGMFAQVEIAAAPANGSEPAAVLAVPDEAVQTVEGTTAVFVPVAGEQNTFKKQVVEVGTPVGGLAPVTSGLKEGEPFVTAGSFILKAELGKGSAEED